MNEWPAAFYGDFLVTASDRTRVREAARAGAEIVMPCHVHYTLPIYLQIWAESHVIPDTSVVAACVDLGRYLDRVYPRAKEPRVPYASAVLNGDRLMARTTRASDITSTFIDRLKVLISRAELSGRFEPVSPAKNAATLGILISPSDTPALDGGDCIQLPVAETKVYPLPGKAIDYLFKAALARETTPSELLIHCVSTGLYFDRNVVLEDEPAAMIQSLIHKTRALDKLARELGSTISALETLLVDWPATHSVLEDRLNRALAVSRA
jgi:hypothetical protein